MIKFANDSNTCENMTDHEITISLWAMSIQDVKVVAQCRT